MRNDLHQRRWLRVHVVTIGLLTFLACWAMSSAMRHGGVESLALRHALALVGAYLVYLGLLWLWSKWLLSREEGDPGPWDGLDSPLPRSSGESPVFQSGCGGDFAGGGSSGSWLPEEGGSAGEAASGALEALSSADEGAIVAIPLVVLVGVALLLASALGFVVFGLFGIEILLGVAVEIAFASTGGALALKARREGWMEHAVRRTIGPMAAVLVASVAASLLLGSWMPEAQTLPEALRLLPQALRGAP